MRDNIRYLLERNTLNGHWRVVMTVNGRRTQTYGFRTERAARRFQRLRRRLEAESHAWQEVAE
jgi:hypothetical protein